MEFIVILVISAIAALCCVGASVCNKTSISSSDEAQCSKATDVERLTDEITEAFTAKKDCIQQDLQDLRKCLIEFLQSKEFSSEIVNCFLRYGNAPSYNRIEGRITVGPSTDEHTLIRFNLKHMDTCFRYCGVGNVDCAEYAQVVKDLIIKFLTRNGMYMACPHDGINDSSLYVSDVFIYR